MTTLEQSPLLILTPSGVNTSTSTITYSAPFTLPANLPVYLELPDPGQLPAPLVTSTQYFVINPTSTTFQLSLTSGGSAISLTTAGTGNMTMYQSSTLNPPASGNYPTPPAIPPLPQAAQAGPYPARKFNKREKKLVQSVTSYVPGSVVSGASAGFTTQPTSVQGALDQLASQGSGGVSKTVMATYDFAVEGGATGTYSLSVAIPADAVITEVATDVITAPTGTAGGTLTLNITDGNLAPALVTGTATTGPLNNTSTPVKAAAARTLQVTIATHPLTAGKAYYFVRYVQSAAT